MATLRFRPDARLSTLAPGAFRPGAFHPLGLRAAAADWLRAVAAALAPRSDAHHLTRLDRHLAYRLFIRFERWGEGGGAGLHFHVQGGAVTVLGTIGSADERAAVLRAVGQTPGVLRVTDRLTEAGVEAEA